MAALALVGGVVLARGHWRSLLLAYGLALATTAVALLIHIQGHLHVPLWGRVEDRGPRAPILPPLDTPELILCLALGVALFLLVRYLEQVREPRGRVS
jgi:hypothetical protein